MKPKFQLLVGERGAHIVLPAPGSPIAVGDRLRRDGVELVNRLFVYGAGQGTVLSGMTWPSWPTTGIERPAWWARTTAARLIGR